MFKCDRCNKEFTKNCSLIAHINKKVKCININKLKRKIEEYEQDIKEYRKENRKLRDENMKFRDENIKFRELLNNKL